MAFPPPLAVAGSMIAALLGASVFYALLRVVHLRATTILIADARRQMRFVVLLILAEFSTIATYRAVVRLQDFAQLGSSEVVLLSFELFRSAIVILLPLVLTMLLSKQTPASVGIRKDNTVNMVAMGVAPSVVFFIIVSSLAPIIGAGFVSLSTSLALRFANNLTGGLSEEIVWRGYVQTRLIARTTRLYGWLASSLAFGLWHLPINYLIFGGVAEALVSSLLIQFPLGLAFGYMMIRSQNILPSSIYHLFINWTPAFFQIPGL